MPSYAILGATGNTGQALLTILHQSPNTTEIHAFCRSKAKLYRLSPEKLSDPRVTVYEGSIKDTTLLSTCIANTTAVFLAVAVPNNVPGNSIAQDTAKAVVEALDLIRKETPDAKIPKLVVLSAAPTDEHLSRYIPPLVRTLLLLAESNIYSDLEAAEKYLRAQSEWISTVFVKPGALARAPQTGHELSLDSAGDVLSFLDLAAGMLEVAETEDLDLKSVSVVPVRKDVEFPWINVWYFLTGLVIHFFPFTYRVIG